ncbi:hypothetical protein [uncultured Gammaproteobacteria bacterium]|nr:hypothetical protein [uncultured Gammaproteobacteria bacterium]SSC10976.1 hypothetical protein BPUTEOSOX_988 [thiotrophic endosymbiont of Bathymodiolus puteoserpentis (Logatchev)]CAC9495724.1 hypothetical protein [uncultured Gammaproteobacteria bacterium]CAC9499265.1 hypothetical protein [uncultured Gammaproteobacteria bacterium]CAC9576290.1 hypothetical protein [uncultured Gammaproteobacteria bacterium]
MSTGAGAGAGVGAEVGFTSSVAHAVSSMLKGSANNSFFIFYPKV